MAPWIIYALLALIAMWESRPDPTAMKLLRVCAVTPVVSWLLVVFIARNRSQLPVISIILPVIVVFLIAASGKNQSTLVVALAPPAVFAGALGGALRIFKAGRKYFIVALAFPFLVFAISYRMLPAVPRFSQGQIWSPEEGIRWDIGFVTNYWRNHEGPAFIRICHGDMPVAKAAGEKRIIVLGSSQVVSPGLKPGEQDFTAVMQRRLNDTGDAKPWRVYNAGIYGADILQWVYWRDLLIKTNPDILVIYESGAMVKPFQERVVFKRAEKIDKKLKNNDTEFRKSAFKWGSASPPVIAFRRAIHANKIAFLLRDFRQAAKRPSAIDAETLIPGTEPPDPDRETVLRWFAESCKKRKIRLIFGAGVHNNHYFADPTYDKLMREVTAEIWGQVIDARPPKEVRENTRMYLDNFNHYSPAGHRWLGKHFADFILPEDQSGPETADL